MVLHLALFRWKEEVTPDAVAHLCDELAAFRRQVDCILDYHFGPDLGLRQGNADFGVAALLGSAERVPEYLDHPAHKELFTRVIAPMCESRTAVQIEVAAPAWR
ncbi:MAG TPA: Dabb family protein [Acidimicrobiales bacterium]|nr:Dabb family protein [Acidimicrobiales bacterium]